MKISSIKYNANKYNHNFKAKLSYEVKEEWEFLGIQLLGLYGPNSDEYLSFRKKMNNIEILCPETKIVIVKNYDYEKFPFYQYGLKKGFKKPRIILEKELDKEALFTTEKLDLLEEELIKESQKEKQKSVKKEKITPKKGFWSKITGWFKK